MINRNYIFFVSPRILRSDERKETVMSSSAVSHSKISPCNGSLIAGKSRQVQVATLAVAGTRLTNPIRDHIQIQSQTLLQTKNPGRDPLIHREITRKPAPSVSGPPLALLGVHGLLGEEVLDDELKVLTERLERAVDRMRVLEVEKFMCRTKGANSSEDKYVVEMMSRKIVDRFLEKPIQYLLCNGTGNLTCKLRDLKFLVDALEGSCSSPAKEQPVCKRT